MGHQCIEMKMKSAKTRDTHQKLPVATRKRQKKSNSNTSSISEAWWGGSPCSSSTSAISTLDKTELVGDSLLKICRDDTSDSTPIRIVSHSNKNTMLQPKAIARANKQQSTRQNQTTTNSKRATQTRTKQLDETTHTAYGRKPLMNPSLIFSMLAMESDNSECTTRKDGLMDTLAHSPTRKSTSVTQLRKHARKDAMTIQKESNRIFPAVQNRIVNVTISRKTKKHLQSYLKQISSTKKSLTKLENKSLYKKTSKVKCSTLCVDSDNGSDTVSVEEVRDARTDDTTVNSLALSKRINDGQRNPITDDSRKKKHLTAENKSVWKGTQRKKTHSNNIRKMVAQPLPQLAQILEPHIDTKLVGTTDSLHSRKELYMHSNKRKLPSKMRSSLRKIASSSQLVIAGDQSHPEIHPMQDTQFSQMNSETKSVDDASMNQHYSTTATLGNNGLIDYRLSTRLIDFTSENIPINDCTTEHDKENTRYGTLQKTCSPHSMTSKKVLFQDDSKVSSHPMNSNAQEKLAIYQTPARLSENVHNNGTSILSHVRLIAQENVSPLSTGGKKEIPNIRKMECNDEPTNEVDLIEKTCAKNSITIIDKLRTVHKVKSFPHDNKTRSSPSYDGSVSSFDFDNDENDDITLGNHQKQKTYQPFEKRQMMVSKAISTCETTFVEKQLEVPIEKATISLQQSTSIPVFATNVSTVHKQNDVKLPLCIVCEEVAKPNPASTTQKDRVEKVNVRSKKRKQKIRSTSTCTSTDHQVSNPTTDKPRRNRVKTDRYGYSESSGTVSKRVKQTNDDHNSCSTSKKTKIKKKKKENKTGERRGKPNAANDTSVQVDYNVGVSQMVSDSAKKVTFKLDCADLGDLPTSYNAIRNEDVCTLSTTIPSKYSCVEGNVRLGMPRLEIQSVHSVEDTTSAEKPTTTNAQLVDKRSKSSNLSANILVSKTGEENSSVNNKCLSIKKSEGSCARSNDWSIEQLVQLQNAREHTDPTKKSFWYDIASRVDGKSASECRDRWYALVQTPKFHKSKKVIGERSMTKQTYSVLDEDDIFNATPMRNIALLDKENYEEMNMFAACCDCDDLSPIHVEVDNAIPQNRKRRRQSSSTNEDSVQIHNTVGIPYKPLVGYKTYIHGIARNVAKANKMNMKKNKKPTKTNNKSGTGIHRVVTDAYDDGTINIKVRLSPGGKLEVNDRTEVDDVDAFWNEEYEEDSDDQCSTEDSKFF